MVPMGDDLKSESDHPRFPMPKSGSGKTKHPPATRQDKLHLAQLLAEVIQAQRHRGEPRKTFNHGLLPLNLNFLP